MQNKLILILFLFCALTVSAADVSPVIAKPVKRGRNEGTASIPASNVVGNGNITVFANAGGGITSNSITGIAGVGGLIGVGGIMQLSAGASVLDFSKMGPAEAHLQLTLPGNDKLRFFGVALSGDLYLSSAVDTVNNAADSSKPFFNPHPLLSAIADLDWLAREKRVPLKTYLMVSLADNPQLLYRYNQLAIKLGAEWKAFRNSICADAGVSMYKEKRNRLNDSGDDMFRQYYVWIRPGARYRLGQRISITGFIGITLFDHLHDNTALDPERLSLSLKVEAPLWFRETNTEAIRTLVFMDQKDGKKKAANIPERADKKTGGDMDDLDIILDGVDPGTETFDYTKEKEDLSKKRVEIQDKMNDIEKFLKELE
jgi:hypothetical protein